MPERNATTLRNRLPLLALGLLATLTLAGCGARTSVSGDWAAQPATALPFSHVLVVGITPNSRARRSFELALVEQLSARGGTATASVQTAESSPQLTPEIVASMVKATGADAVAITRVANRRIAAEETASRTGVKTQHPANLNGGAGIVELFSLEYSEYEEPGELHATSTAIVETSVYEVRDGGRLVYNLTTTSEFREDRNDVIGDVTRAIATRLREERLVR